MKYLFLTAFTVLGLSLNAQNDGDALRYSMLNRTGTARSLAMGGAMGALGADLSVTTINPAGIAMYRRSEFSISPAFLYNRNTSNFQGQELSDSRFNFNFGTTGVVWTRLKDKKTSPWKSWSFGIVYNRLGDFSERTMSEGVNNQNSILDDYLGQIQGTVDSILADQFPFDAGLAYQTGLIYRDYSDSLGYSYLSAIPNGGALQKRSSVSKGGHGTLDFSYGMNYQNMLYIGATLGITTLRYREDITYEEVDEAGTVWDGDPNFNFKSLKYTQSLVTEGTGVNFSLGIIYKPSDFVRLGLAIHTPTSYSLTDDYITRMKAVFENNKVYEAESPDFIPFEYELVTPFRTIASVAFVFGQTGLISADYEYTDFGDASMNSVDPQFNDYFNDVNKNIQLKYVPGHQFRIGGELRQGELRFRLGGSYATSPFDPALDTSSETDLSMISYTGGLGFRQDHFYFDAGYAYTIHGSFLRQYALSSEDVPGIKRTHAGHKVQFTFGFLF